MGAELATLAQVEALVARQQAFDPARAVRTFRFGLPDSMEILIMPALLARMREVAPGIHLRLYNFDASRLLEDLDADEMDLAIGYDLRQQGQVHHKRRKLFAESWLCMFNAELTGIVPPISLDDFVRLPHVLTSLRPDRNVRGIVDEALEKARPAPLRRPHHAAFPDGAVFGGARPRHRHHAGPPGAPVRRRTRA
jgi:DNA-binding transcriptional LysR family regulator